MRILFQKTKRNFCRVCGCLSQGIHKKNFQRTTETLRQASSGLSGQYLVGFRALPSFSSFVICWFTLLLAVVVVDDDGHLVIGD